MKRKIALLLVLVLSLSVVLAACSSSCDEHVDADRNEICDVCEEYVKYVPAYLGFEGIYNTALEEEDDDEILYSKAQINSSLNDMTFDYNGSGNLVVFRDYSAEAGETKALVLNTDTGETVLVLKEEDDDATVEKEVRIDTNNYDTFIRVIETDTTDRNSTVYKQTLYTALGEEITSKTSKVNANISIQRLGYTADHEGSVYLIEDKVYEITDDVAEYKFDKGFTRIPTGNTYLQTENYYYNLNSYSEIYVYDLQYNLVAYYAVPAECEMVTRATVLADGNVLIQYEKELPWDAAEYDLYEKEVKYDFYTVIFNVADGTVKEIEFNYEVSDVVNSTNAPAFFSEYFVEGSVENVAVVYPIVDKAVDYDDIKYINVDSNLFLIGFLGEEIANQNGMPSPIADNRFIVSNEAGQKFLINEKAEVIGEVTAASFNSDLGYFVMNNKYYDLDLKLVFDANEIEYTYYEYNNSSNYSIYYDTNIEGEGEDESIVTTYYIRNGITFSELELPENFYSLNIYNNYFTYKYSVENDGYYDYYTVYCNANGEKIFSVQTNEEGYYYKTPSVILSGDTLIIKLDICTDNYEYSTKYYIAN